jgi:aryl carrier-like protein
MADIKRPRTPIGSDEMSTAVQTCDAATLDTFIQVAGLLVNSSENCPADQVYIATRIQSVVMQDCNFTNEADEWVVYVMSTSPGNDRVACDVFALDRCGELKFTASGIQFTRHLVAELEIAFDHTMTTSPPDTRVNEPKPGEVHTSGLRADTPNSNVSERDISESTNSTPPTPATSIGSTSQLNGEGIHDSPRAGVREKVVELITENSGAAIRNIDDTDCLLDLGIDSLSLIELKASLQASFRKHSGLDGLDSRSTLPEILGFLDPSVASIVQ